MNALYRLGSANYWNELVVIMGMTVGIVLVCWLYLLRNKELGVDFFAMKQIRGFNSDLVLLFKRLLN